MHKQVSPGKFCTMLWTHPLMIPSDKGYGSIRDYMMEGSYITLLNNHFGNDSSKAVFKSVSKVVKM